MGCTVKAESANPLLSDRIGRRSKALWSVALQLHGIGARFVRQPDEFGCRVHATLMVDADLGNHKDVAVAVLTKQSHS